MDSSDEYKGESDSCSDSGSSRERNKRKSRFFDEDLVHFQASKDAYQKQLNASTGSDLLKGSLIPIVKLSNISPLKSDSESFRQLVMVILWYKILSCFNYLIFKTQI